MIKKNTTAVFHEQQKVFKVKFVYLFGANRLPRNTKSRIGD
jgi:hypothetical protein